MLYFLRQFLPAIGWCKTVRRPVFLINLGLCLATFPVGLAANIDRTEVNSIVRTMGEFRADNFRAFLTQLSQVNSLSSETSRVISTYLDQATLDEPQSNTLYRLLGIYARLNFGDQALETLRQLVRIPSFQVEGLPQHENPNFLLLGNTVAEIAQDFGLQFRNVDNRIFEVTINGSTDELIGIHAHGDVVPVNPDLWVLDDGTRLDPFDVTAIGNRLYGRGTEDDKNGIVASLYAMKIIQEENLPLLRDIRLLIDTTEETTSEAIPYYFERNPIPQYNIALDGSYPVVIAEKGFGTVMTRFPRREGIGEGGEIISLSGGLATNQIPSASVARIRSPRPDELASELTEKGAQFVAGYGGDFQILAYVEDSDVVLTVRGVSAHSSDPASGINPVSRMLLFLNQLHEQRLFQGNHITDAARYATDNWGLDYYGNTLGIAYADDFMGPLTTSLTFIALDDAVMRLAVNLRLPIGRAPEALLADISAKLDSWSATTGIDATFELSAAEPMYRNPEGAWVNALLDIASETLSIPREFGSSAGATSIHDLPDGVQFGLAMPDARYSGHNANEFKTIDQFLLDLQIVTEMFATIGSMPEL